MGRRPAGIDRRNVSVQPDLQLYGKMRELVYNQKQYASMTDLVTKALNTYLDIVHPPIRPPHPDLALGDTQPEVDFFTFPEICYSTLLPMFLDYGNIFKDPTSVYKPQFYSPELDAYSSRESMLIAQQVIKGVREHAKEVIINYKKKIKEISRDENPKINTNGDIN